MEGLVSEILVFLLLVVIEIACFVIYELVSLIEVVLEKNIWIY